MKRTIHTILLFGILLFLTGCAAFEIEGIENFNENDCSFGLNCGLLPDDRNFLSDHPYENGVYHYRRNNYGWAEAKTYVKLQYSSEVYDAAKSTCLQYYTLFDSKKYNVGTCEFQIITDSVHHCIELNYPSSFWMLGIDDKTNTLIFIGYLNRDLDDKILNVAQSDFSVFYNLQFGEYHEGQ